MTSTPQRRDRLDAFYADNQHRLQHALARRIRANPELIEDACATALAILARRPDVTLDARGLGWLTTVAFNEALRLINLTSGEFAVGLFQARWQDERDGDETDIPAPADIEASPADERALELIEHRERVAAFRQLKPRQREALYLKSLGYSYNEIAQLTDSTYTAVISGRMRQLRRHVPPSRRRHVIVARSSVERATAPLRRTACAARSCAGPFSEPRVGRLDDELLRHRRTRTRSRRGWLAVRSAKACARFRRPGAAVESSWTVAPGLPPVWWTRGKSGLIVRRRFVTGQGAGS